MTTHDTRITPACAGNRPLKSSGHFARRDHPRVCGEQMAGYTNTDGRKGSPPRVRGTAQKSSLTLGRRRITPACAGNRR